MSLQAILFDCDGVLVDTERDGHRVAFNRAFKESGIDANWSVERYRKLLETAGGKERMRAHFDEMGWPPSIDDRDVFIADLHKKKTRIFMELIKDNALALRPGIAQLMDEAIADGIKMAICSTSNEKSVQAIVDVLLGSERAKYLPVFAGDMVSAKKPDPAIYNLGRDNLNIDPKYTVVVEDSEIGAKAALAANMHCIVTTSTYTVDENFSGVDEIVPSLENISLKDIKSLI